MVAPRHGLVGESCGLGLAGQLDDLERAHDAAPVLRVDARRGLGVDRAQSRVQQARAALGELGLEPRAHRGIGAREPEVVDHATTRTAPSRRRAARRRPARDDLVDRGAGGALVGGDRCLLGDVEHVEQVVRHAAALGERELRRADVHAAVELHGVGVDDLGGSARAFECRSEVEREVGLAGARRADDRDERHVSAARRWGRRWAWCRRRARRAARRCAREASAGRARRGLRRMTRRRPVRAQLSASARSHASPARVRRMTQRRVVDRVGEQVERRGVGDRHRDDVARPRQLGAGGHLEVHEAAVFGAAAQAVRLGVLLALARRRRAPRPVRPTSFWFSSHEMRSCSAVSRS